jgi:hypothetical protein
MIVVRLLATSALLISALCAAAVSAVTQPASAQAASCAAPCWQSFQPGVTTFGEAVALFDGVGWELAGNYCRSGTFCNTYAWAAPDQPDHRAGSVFTLGLLDAIVIQKPESRLGDLLLSLGAPDSVDQYKSFDSTGARYTIYRVGWDTTELQIRLDCPMTYADLLFRSPTVISLSVADTVQREYSPNLLQNRPDDTVIENFRVVCRS